MARRVVTYPPVDVPKQVAENLWIVDGGPIEQLGMTLPIRMTVIRLASGELLLHSPIPCSAALHKHLRGLGRIRHLLAPSFGHWQFVAQWQGACPETETWVVPGLRHRRQVRSSRLEIDHELHVGETHPWGEEIELRLVPGGAGFHEAALFHRPSRTLVLTDLVVNLERRKLPALSRIGARLVGGLAPEGMAPLHLRLLLRRRRREVREAAEVLVSFAPERVIFAHGEWFERDGEARLRHSLRWILR